MRYNITFKEVGSERLGHCAHIGSKSKQEVIDFFGLDESDVEWYKIEEEN